MTLVKGCIMVRPLTLKVCSPTIFVTFFSHDRDIWIAATDYYMYLMFNVYIIMLLPLTAILQIMNFTAT